MYRHDLKKAVLKSSRKKYSISDTFALKSVFVAVRPFGQGPVADLIKVETDPDPALEKWTKTECGFCN